MNHRFCYLSNDVDISCHEYDQSGMTVSLLRSDKDKVTSNTVIFVFFFLYLNVNNKKAKIMEQCKRNLSILRRVCDKVFSAAVPHRTRVIQYCDSGGRGPLITQPSVVKSTTSGSTCSVDFKVSAPAKIQDFCLLFFFSGHVSQYPNFTETQILGQNTRDETRTVKLKFVPLPEVNSIFE